MNKIEIISVRNSLINEKVVDEKLTLKVNKFLEDIDKKGFSLVSVSTQVVTIENYNGPQISKTVTIVYSL